MTLLNVFYDRFPPTVTDINFYTTVNPAVEVQKPLEPSLIKTVALFTFSIIRDFIIFMRDWRRGGRRSISCSISLSTARQGAFMKLKKKNICSI